mmetsp:Transcript_6440/g.10205  ORF Transcript_6440/g.10205 Transcript_6440/m.10205 type:complete len:636 (+) Transcript_6440:71-1978(+)
MAGMLLTSIACLAFILLKAHAAFYLPGVKPRSFETRENVPLQVTALTSTKKQLPVDYYDLPFCKPEKIKKAAENLGEVLEGDVITSSPYELEMKVPDACKVLCRRELNQKEMNAFKSVIKENYRVHWLVDNLPVAMYHEKFDYYSRGFPVGFTMVGEEGDRRHYLNNHARIVIAYHEDPDSFQGARVVGFEVVPFSVKHSYEDAAFDPQLTTLHTCNEMTPAVNDLETLMSADAPGEVIFTYDVKWVRSEVQWSQRWDVYLKGNPNEEIHYFSILNSLMIVLFLSGVVGMIMVRTLRRDIASYNEGAASAEEAGEESGWKLVHGDVFRPPERGATALAALVGQGMQLLALATAVLLLALAGFLSPANRGGLLTAVLTLYVLGGAFSGYYAARLFKFFGKKEWKRCTLTTALLYPGAVFAIFLFLDVVEQWEGSSAAVSFGTLVGMLALWLGVCTPLVFAGAFHGFKKPAYEAPVRTHNFPRFIPECQWYNKPAVSIALGGILPFGAVCIELFFIMSALWLHQIYYVFGFLMAVLLILALTCAEIAVVLCYAQLCAEDYRWWWRSFCSAGSSAGYLYLYSIWYFATKLHISGLSSCLVYFGNMLIISLTFFLLTGSIGFLSCFWFVRTIYSAIKVD